jgi:hypothetical protein
MPLLSPENTLPLPMVTSAPSDKDSVFSKGSSSKGSKSEECKGKKVGHTLSQISCKSLLSSRLLSKNVKVRIYKTIILPMVLYGCETWSLDSKRGT